MEEIESRLDELEAALRENKKVLEENNKILKKLYRAALWRRTLTVVYWVIIIGVAVGVFYFLQPYVEQFSRTYQDVSNIINSSSSPASIFFQR